MQSTESGHDDVVVVGAGPVGLWTAAELGLGGVPAVVLERADERSPHSKALGVHPRTLEVLAMRGLAERFLAEGVPLPRWHFGMLESPVDLSVLDTPYPFMLAIPQRRTEELLEEHALAAGARILRGHRVTNLTQDEHGVRLEVSGPDGPYTRFARYVVGADGVGSVVRTSAGIAFEGTETTFYGYLGEVRVTSEPVRGAHNEHGAMLSVPLRDGRYRISGVDKLTGHLPGPLTLDALRESTIRVAGSDFGMHDPSWLTRFGDAAKLAERYRHGRVLLAGDAAHRHLPAGGVGLNVGVQDAMNLGWRLAAVARGDADPALLDAYHDERHPVGEQLVEHTLGQSALITATAPDGIALRAVLSRLIAEVPELSLALARKLSALDVAYAAGDHPLVGKRVPVPPSRHARPAVLVATAAPIPAATAAAAKWGFDVVTAPLPWTTAAVVLVRPDGHVWTAADEADDERIAAALDDIGVRFPGAPG
ncbi:putative aromatic compound monooxygenase YhjG [Amycolatopsis sp. NBRC 101858]|uniref:FAD-dependent monooxygenase n=1 Tax=Amycolatopsis sp. NBRC 101858 TaxID=3032200 RepID=UPI0024A1DFA7|nr:FAD-dependent monooxygenase [Amycolatopsis sp. NBRC 101858]GLY43360.1 putative aromatic compound monooxygenase YhjG [Amycolatopsis sp. NBRC 101858]